MKRYSKKSGRKDNPTRSLYHEHNENDSYFLSLLLPHRFDGRRGFTEIAVARAGTAGGNRKTERTQLTACCKKANFPPEMMQLPSPLAKYLSQYTRMRVAREKLKELLSLWDAAQFVYSPRQEDFINHFDPNKAGVSSRVREELTSDVLHTLSNTQLKLV